MSHCCHKDSPYPRLNLRSQAPSMFAKTKRDPLCLCMLIRAPNKGKCRVTVDYCMTL